MIELLIYWADVHVLSFLYLMFFISWFGIAFLVGIFPIKHIYSGCMTYFALRFRDNPDVVELIKRLSVASKSSYEHAERRISENSKEVWIVILSTCYVKSNLFLQYHAIVHRKYPLCVGDIGWVLMFPLLTIGVTTCHLAPKVLTVLIKMVLWVILKLRILFSARLMNDRVSNEPETSDEEKPPYAGLFKE